MPTADREMFLRLVGRIAAEPEGADRHLAYTTDTVTRAAWEDHVMVHYVVTRFFVAVMEADIYDVSRAFNEEMISSVTDDEVLEAVKARVRAGRPTDLGSHLLTPAPASAEALAEAERIIGYPLPPLLRRLYTEVANGGFGPFGGIEGLRDGYTSDGPSMLEMYLQYDEPGPDPEEQAPPSPPHGVLLVCNHGCAMWSMLDCRHPEGQMWWWDQGDRHKCDLTLRDWMIRWLDGRLEHGIPGHLAVEDEESWCWPETDGL